MALPRDASLRTPLRTYAYLRAELTFAEFICSLTPGKDSAKRGVCLKEKGYRDGNRKTDLKALNKRFSGIED